MTLRLPLIMGLTMGMMMPFMLHIAPAAGWAFVLAHVAVAVALGTIALLALRFDKIRAYTSRLHRPDVRHMTAMALSGAFGFGVICVYCFVIGGTH